MTWAPMLLDVDVVLHGAGVRTVWERMTLSMFVADHVESHGISWSITSRAALRRWHLDRDAFNDSGCPLHLTTRLS